MAEREIKAGEFKAKCLQLMDDVAETGDTIVVTKRGKPVARLVPVSAKPLGPKFGFYKEIAQLIGADEAMESPWDAEMDAAFEDGLQRTAELINPPKRSKRRKRA